MKRDHFGFGLTMAIFLLAPKIPLGGSLGTPGTSGVPAGFLGLLIWAALQPGHIRKIKWGPRWLPSILFTCYGLYCLAVSIMSAQAIAIVYAAQYAFYVVVGYMLLSGYVARAARNNELNTTLRIVAVIGFVFAVGVVVSVFAGPFYRYETLWTARLWGGIRIQQGVGFAEGTNAAGAMLIVLNSLYYFAYKSSPAQRWLLSTAATVALACTISRSSIAAFVAGLSALCVVYALRTLVRRRTSLVRAGRIVAVTFAALAALAIALHVVSAQKPELMAALAYGFGAGGTSLLESESSRLGYWQSGVESWWQSGTCQAVFGKGFRLSQSIGEYGAWQTSHSLYISVLGDFGLVGLFFLLTSFAAFLARATAEILRDGGRDTERAAFVAIVALLMHNATEVFLYSPVLAGMVLLLFAMESISRDAPKQPRTGQ